jgi:hypothetical protein
VGLGKAGAGGVLFVYISVCVCWLWVVEHAICVWGYACSLGTLWEKLDVCASSASL